ncbi:hypothetical protein HDV00_001741 [Rhizophlyctis rosea]|nr:hypothetical protein HDV00_001741 [Rhizophlyctis rosea]
MTKGRGNLGRIQDKVLGIALKSDLFDKPLNATEAKKLFKNTDYQSFDEYVSGGETHKHDVLDPSNLGGPFKASCLRILSALFAGLRFGYIKDPLPFDTTETDKLTGKWKGDVDVDDLFDALDAQYSTRDPKEACCIVGLVKASVSGWIYNEGDDTDQPSDRWAISGSSVFGYPPDDEAAKDDPDKRKVYCVVSMVDAKKKQAKRARKAPADPEDDPAQAKRIIKILAHYIAKELLSLRVCTLDPSCIMAVVPGREFLGPVRFCRGCYQKLHYRLNWNVKRRYEGLREVLAAIAGFEEEVEWLDKMLKHIEEEEFSGKRWAMYFGPTPRKRKGVSKDQTIGELLAEPAEADAAPTKKSKTRSPSAKYASASASTSFMASPLNIPMATATPTAFAPSPLPPTPSHHHNHDTNLNNPHLFEVLKEDIFHNHIPTPTPASTVAAAPPPYATPHANGTWQSVNGLDPRARKTVALRRLRNLPFTATLEDGSPTASKLKELCATNDGEFWVTYRAFEDLEDGVLVGELEDVAVGGGGGGSSSSGGAGQEVDMAKEDALVEVLRRVREMRDGVWGGVFDEMGWRKVKRMARKGDQWFLSTWETWVGDEEEVLLQELKDVVGV